MPQHVSDNAAYNRMVIGQWRVHCEDLNRRSRAIRELSAASSKRSSELRARSAALLEAIARRTRAALADME